MRRRLECCVCGSQVEVEDRQRIRACRRCGVYTPHLEIGLVAEDGRFFGFHNIGELLEEALSLARYRAELHRRGGATCPTL
ncbi:MAG: hypothetical protein ACRDHO_11830 [Actinomycetota bacterium]